MKETRILALTPREDFIGRDAELRAITQQSSPLSESRGLMLMAAPAAGASELLRQGYDQIFVRRGEAVPLHFAFQHGELRADAARRFFRNSLQQYVAYRRADPSLCEGPLTFRELAELSLATDYELVTNLIESYECEEGTPRDFVDFCFGLPRRLLAEGRNVYALIDFMAVQPFGEELNFAHEVARGFGRASGQFTLAGLRRQMGELIHGSTDGSHDAAGNLHLERLSDDESARLIEVLARRYGVESNQPTRDLIVQQLSGSPFYIDEFLRFARDAKTTLTSFLNCQRLYVDQLLGGNLKRHFDRIIASVVANSQTKRTLLRVLYESAISETRKSSLWAWKKRLGLPSHEFEGLIESLHVHELVNSTAAFIEINTDSDVWMDYLRAQYQLDVAGEPRAKVVATLLLDTLKRAPQAMARKYRRDSAIGLPDVMLGFNCQSVPTVLLHYQRFAQAYRGGDINAIEAGLEAEPELIRLPQFVYSAPSSSYSKGITCDADRCVVAHGFEAAEYTNENEIVWLVVEVDSKLEASSELTREWCDRLTGLARESGFDRFRIWLIAREGFSEDADEVLKQHNAFSSNRQQFDLLVERLEPDGRESVGAKSDEYEMVIPMGEDSELVAARAVEEIARRVNFRPEAINQIKTALVEACINAAEHSLSPDRKIYQRFVVEDDKLVVTVASRGVVSAQLSDQNGQRADVDSTAKSRRGWGLKLIKTLMDQVEFERVDDGTQLRMTKYLR